MVVNAATFASGFFKRHPSLKPYAPKNVLDKVGSEASHPEARQHGSDVWLYPKFWKLDAETRDFVFAHELGHYVLDTFGLSRFVAVAAELGVDVWGDTQELPFAQNNMHEAFADCFATYMLNRSEINARYPLWAKLVKAVLT